jgi:hypothetical protein
MRFLLGSRQMVRDSPEGSSRRASRSWCTASISSACAISNGHSGRTVSWNQDIVLDDAFVGLGDPGALGRVLANGSCRAY